MNHRCGTCRYFDIDDTEPPFVGKCRRYPPGVVAQSIDDLPDEVGVTVWPSVHPTDDWCGEHPHLELPR